MKIPRDVSGKELAKVICRKYGYKITRQVGSHIRLSTRLNGTHNITIPAHKFIRVGLLDNILRDIAYHLKVDKEVVVKELFG